MQYGMVIDTKACMGCTACAVKCKQSNNLPNQVWWNFIRSDSGRNEIMTGTYPNNSLTYYATACQHCANPSCEAVCPTGATHKDEETGIVLVDREACIGCQACIEACPYDVRTYIGEEPAWYIDVVQGEQGIPAHKQGVVEKCELCYERVSRGLEPACVEVCPGRARFFGDLDDPKSEVSQMVAAAGAKATQLLAESGTAPSVYYLV